MLLNSLFFCSVIIHVLYLNTNNATKVPLKKFSSFSFKSLKNKIKPFLFNKLIHNTNDFSEINRIPEAAIFSKLVYDIDYKKIQENFNQYSNNEPFKIILNPEKHFLNHSKKYFDALSLHDIVLDDLSIDGFFIENRLQGFSVINHYTKEIYMIFRGNQFWNEWSYSLIHNGLPIPFLPNFNFHNGIYKLYSQKNINKLIVDNLINLYDKYPYYSKIFAGHSRGSINCVLSALEILYGKGKFKEYDQKKEKILIYTFGSPPLFTKVFSHFLHKHNILNIYQIQNDDDLITHIPLFNNCQFGQRIVMKGDNQFTFWENVVPVYLSRFMTCLTHVVQSINEHDMKCYIQRIFSNFL